MKPEDTSLLMGSVIAIAGAVSAILGHTISIYAGVPIMAGAFGGILKAAWPDPAAPVNVAATTVTTIAADPALEKALSDIGVVIANYQAQQLRKQAGATA